MGPVFFDAFSWNESIVSIYPGTCLSSILVVEPSERRTFPMKTSIYSLLYTCIDIVF